MLEQFAQWAIRLYGSPCCVCGRPAVAMWVLAEVRVVQHVGDRTGTAVCRMPNPPAQRDPSESERAGRTRAA
jgi:hypothetical protein